MIVKSEEKDTQTGHRTPEFLGEFTWHIVKDAIHNLKLESILRRKEKFLNCVMTMMRSSHEMRRGVMLILSRDGPNPLI